jgi:hypothetical protein
MNENTASIVKYCVDSHFEIAELLDVIHETAYNCVNEGRQEDFENALQRIVHLARFGASAVFDRCEYISYHPGAEGAWGKS